MATSAYRRYLQCKSEIRRPSLDRLAENPFLQIDWKWPGTYRYLVHPYVDLLTHQTSLARVQELMVLADMRFRHVLFLGPENAMRRRYEAPEAELLNLREAWNDCTTDKLRIRYFPDALCAALGWMHEAVLIGDVDRCRLLMDYDVLRDDFGISFTQLKFLPEAFAAYMDRWFSVVFHQLVEVDPHRFSVETLAMEYVWGRDPPEVAELLDVVAVQRAIFAAESLNRRGLLETTLRTRVPGRAMDDSAAASEVSWARLDLKPGS